MTGKREGHPCCGLHSWSVDQIDTSQSAQGRGRCRGLLLLQATFWVLEVLEVEQEQAGEIYWSAFDGDGMKEGGAVRTPYCRLHWCWRCWRQNSQAVQEGRRCRGHPRRRPYLNYNGGNVPGIAGNKVGNGGQPQDTISPDGDL
ncbi:hypothetical protein B0H14DRAFT_2649437 [Mycena olivaceomarginata]|nr:hypothetical protein B0H14DRAFT_2649437 [Mycena olivaceomarginata]